jgi:hypothetical protein
MARLEQTFMLGFYCIRKLIEAGKVSATTVRRAVPLFRFEPTGKAVTKLNWDEIDSLYRLEAPRGGSMELRELCHQFVHSYVFIPSLGESGGLEGVFVASDRQRRKDLLYVTLDDIVQAIEAVVDDDPEVVEMQFDPTIGDYQVRVAE